MEVAVHRDGIELHPRMHCTNRALHVHERAQVLDDAVEPSAGAHMFEGVRRGTVDRHV